MPQLEREIPDGKGKTTGVSPLTESLRSLTSQTRFNPVYEAPYDTQALVNLAKKRNKQSATNPDQVKRTEEGTTHTAERDSRQYKRRKNRITEKGAFAVRKGALITNSQIKQFVENEIDNLTSKEE